MEDLSEAEACMSRSAGHCMTMGTASTMASMVEALGVGLPTNAAIPAADARRYALAHAVGRRAVEIVKDDLKLSKILTKKNVKNAKSWDEKVITPFKTPFKPQGGIAVVRGNLAPQGAVLKPSAASPKLMKHRGRAVVFEDIADYYAKIDDPKLDVDADCVLV